MKEERKNKKRKKKYTDYIQTSTLWHRERERENTIYVDFLMFLFF